MNNENINLTVENEKKSRPKNPPLANYEDFDEEPDVDDIDGERRPLTRGIDDGFLVPGLRPRTNKPDVRTSDGGSGIVPSGYYPQWPTYYPENEAGHFPSLNMYQQKKTIAQGMLDIALLSANANQLRYILDFQERNRYFYVSVSLISSSLVLQVLVAIGLVFKSRYDIEDVEEYRTAEKINNFLIIGILLITIINVFTSAFGVAPPETVLPRL